MRLAVLTLSLSFSAAAFAQTSGSPEAYTLTGVCGEFKLYSARYPNIEITLVRPKAYSEEAAEGKIKITGLRPITKEGTNHENQEEDDQGKSKSKRENKKGEQEEFKSTYSTQELFDVAHQSLIGAVELERKFEQKVHVCIFTLMVDGTETTRLGTSKESNEEARDAARDEFGLDPIIAPEEEG